jgi:hypothetical protein
MRLGQLARELKIKPSEIVKFLKVEAKVEIENGPNARLEDEHVSLVTDKFANLVIEELKEITEVIKEKSVEEKVQKPTPKKPVAKESRVSDDDEVFPDPKTIAVDPNAELIRARKPNFQEFKIIDKIDLPETNAKTVIEVDGVMLSPEEVEQRELKEKEERDSAIEAERERKAEIKAEKDKERVLAEENRLEKLAIDQERKRIREEEAEKKRKETEAKKIKQERTAFYKTQQASQGNKSVKKAKKRVIEEEEVDSEEKASIEEPKTGLAKLWQWFNT